MSITVNLVRHGFFLDSVALMRISRTIGELPGIEEAALMMGTPSNKQIMRDANLLKDASETAVGGDLIVGIRGINLEAADLALETATDLLNTPKHSGDERTVWQPKSIRAGVVANPDRNFAIISVPGDFAAAEARKALKNGLHTMIFSDNVSIEDEIALKEEAKAQGLFLMGPDCGTAIIGGVPLGFANVIARGDIGVIGASGTGIQEVTSLVDRAGNGISHAIGVGGRDLSIEVGAITTLMAIDAFECDPSTRHIIVISKPPDKQVVSKIVKRIATSSKTFTLCLIGSSRIELPANATQVHTLKEAASHAVSVNTAFDWYTQHKVMPLPAGRPLIRGLFSGGTLASEAQLVLHAGDEKVTSNAPLNGIKHLSDSDEPHHIILDLGSDEYTRGRPHPMIDPSVRDDVLIEAVKDPSVGLILLDLILGYGANSNPAAHIAQCIANVKIDRPLIITSVTGTVHDPQDYAAQIKILEAAGAIVAPTNADAAAYALACLQTNS
tara:strand:+ start:1735 stop:3231 length:1497 start_codon:yes stop_codon:yes gene_type:complete